ncbi:MAG: STAS domain-containing protein [Candidatus Cloacimonetes bacterium]|nr:STAS domain-containing protein [Candidatus Cloacimonadota bacterium]
MLEHTLDKSGNMVTLILKGRIDGLTAPKLELLLNTCIMQGDRQLIVDMKEINYVSSLGLRVLLKIQKVLKKVDGELIIKEPSEIVLSVLQLSAFDKIFTIYGTVNPTTETITTEKEIEYRKNVRIETLTRSKEKGVLISIGNMKKMKEEGYTETDVVEMEAEKTRFGLAIAALGNNYKEFNHLFGEALIVEHSALVYPAVEKSAVDIILAQDDNQKSVYNFFSGLCFNGEFSHIFKLESEGNIPLTDLIQFIREKSPSEYTGIVMLAESKGFWGINLKKVPLSENNPSEMFDEKKIIDWLTFPIEPEFYNNLLLGVGIIAAKKTDQDENIPHSHHIHAAILDDRIINKNPEHFEQEILRHITETEIRKIQHVLDDTVLGTVLCGIVPLGEMEIFRNN